MGLWGTEAGDEKLKENIGKEKMSGAQVLVRFLEAKGVSQLYGIPGAAILPFYDAVIDSEQIESYVVRHEQMAVFMADGYSRTTGKVGVCACTSGPAATNFITGLYGAYGDSVPLLAFTGQAPSAFVGKDAFQEAPVVEMAQHVTKGAFLVKKAEDLPGIIKEAWRLATTGRKGPVLLDLCLDAQKGMVDVDLDELLFEEPEVLPRAGQEEIRKCLEMIRGSRRPVLYVGGGVVLADAAAEFRQLAETLRIPVVCTLMGKDALPNDHELFAGMVGTICNSPLGNKTFLESDLVVALGGRFGDRGTGAIDLYTKGRRFIHVNLDPREINRHVKTELGIAADLKSFLQSLNALIEEIGYVPGTAAESRIQGLLADKPKVARQREFDHFPMKPQHAMYELRKNLKRDAIVTHDCGISQIWSSQMFEMYEPRTYLITGRAGTMGWGLGAALAAKLAKPGTQVVNLLGDGSLGMSLQDLATAAKFNIPVIIFVLNNSLLGLIRQQQNLFFDKRRLSTELDYENVEMGHARGIDFVATARGMGVAAELVEKPEEIKEALGRAFAANRPYLIEVLVDPEAVCSVSRDGTIAGVVETV